MKQLGKKGETMEAVEAMEKNGKKSFLEMPLAQRARHLKIVGKIMKNRLFTSGQFGDKKWVS